MPDRHNLLALHHKTLDVLNDAGDMLTSNEPFAPGRRRSPRFRASWNASGIHIGFRDDIAPETRRCARRWMEHTGPTAVKTVPSLIPLADCFGTTVEEIGLGVAYSTVDRAQTTGAAALITEGNVKMLPEGCLEAGELDFVTPSFAFIVEGRAVSTALTVRRIPDAIEVGVDTVEGHRGKGYAVEVTSAWVNNALEEGLIPFYSTSSDNVASQRVAEKVGFQQFATDLRIR